jgi:hypothetical protein
LDALARLNGADTHGSLHFHCLLHHTTFFSVQTRMAKVTLQKLCMEMSEDFIKVLNSLRFLRTSPALPGNSPHTVAELLIA